MYIKEFDIAIDIKNQTDQEPFEVVQGDSQSNLLNISMTDGLEPYDLTGTTAEIVFYKSDSTTVQQTQESGVVVLNAPDGKIQCTLKTNTIACPGKVIAEVRISSDAVLLTSAQFKFYVRKSLINDDTIKSTDEFPVLTQLMQDTSTLIEQVNQIEKQVPENVVSRIDAMETGKANKNDMVQSDTISDATKYPSTVVTAAHRRELDELNKNLQFFKIIRVDNDSGLPDNPSEIGRDMAYIIIKTGGTGMFIGYEANPNYGIQLNLSYFNGVRYRIKNNSLTFGEWVQL